MSESNLGPRKWYFGLSALGELKQSKIRFFFFFARLLNLETYFSECNGEGSCETFLTGSTYLSRLEKK